MKARIKAVTYMVVAIMAMIATVGFVWPRISPVPGDYIPLKYLVGYGVALAVIGVSIVVALTHEDILRERKLHATEVNTRRNQTASS